MFVTSDLPLEYLVCPLEAEGKVRIQSIKDHGTPRNQEAETENWARGARI